MKKILLIFVILTSGLSFGQGKLPEKFVPPITEEMLSSEVISQLGGVSNSNITVVTSIADITEAGANAICEFQTVVSMPPSDYQPPANQTWIFTTGYLDAGTYILDLNGSSILFNGKRKGLDLFNASVTGNVTLLNDNLYSSNCGAIDDNLETTDNFNVGKNLLHIANQNNGHLVWNKTDTGKFWATAGYPYQFGSPFFPNVPNAASIWLVGNGYDNVTVEHAGTEIISKTTNTIGSRRYIFYNTRASEIKGGTLRGDRYRHFYDQGLFITSAATSAGSVRVLLEEVDERISFNTTKTIDENIPLTLSNISTNVQEITDYINTDPDFADYTATNRGLVTTDIHGETVTARYEVSLRGPGGSDYELSFTDVDSGAGVVENWSSYEWAHAISYGSGSLYCKVSDIHLTEFHGDGIDTQLQGNGTTGILFADLTQGYIDEDGVIDGGNTGYYYLTTPRELPRDMEWFSFAPNSQSSMNLKHNKYWIIYLDGSNNFLEKSPTLIPYEKYVPRSNVVNYRILVEANGTNINDFNYFVNSRSEAIGAIFENVEISFVRRDGISNPPNDYVIKDCKIHDCGGQEPQIGINMEDNTKHQRGGRIVRVEFWNNANGDIIIKGATQTEITGCFFKQNSFNVRGLQDAKGLGVSTAFGRHTLIHNNFFEHKYNTLDIGAHFHHNDLYYSRVDAQYGGVKIENNTFENSSVNGGQKGGITDSFSAGGNAVNYLTNNTFIINDDWGNERWMDDYNTFISRGNILKFNDLSSRSFTLNDPTLSVIKVGSSTNYMRSDRTIPDGNPYLGSTDDEIVSGLVATDADLHGVYYTKYVSNIDRLKVEFPLAIEAGFPKSVTLKNISAYKLYLKLNQFATDGVGDFETITIKDSYFRVPARTDATKGWLNNSFYGTPSRSNFINIKQDANVNLVIENCDFISDDVTTGLFAYFGQRGTLTFKNCRLSHPSGETIDLSLTGNINTLNVYASVNVGEITFLDCEFTNVTISGVPLKYTTPHPNCPSYADNATALAALGEGYWYKNTTSGKFDTTNL